jgi:tRNA U38,U39,U40 pseudouridine synthase TruA
MGKIDLETFMGYINKTHERQHKEMAYPQGLYLSGIKYPEFNFLVKSPGFLSLLDSFNKDQHQY